MNRLLIIDDDPDVLETVAMGFSNTEYDVLCANSAYQAEPFLNESPDLILMDIMMPDVDGIQYCQQIRERVECPIVFLSARTDENSKLMALMTGGDDYLTKPFSLTELRARVDAHLRREGRPRARSARTQFGNMWIDYAQKEVGVGQETLSLTRKEYEIVELLSLNAAQVFTQDRIYETVWGFDAQGDARSAVTEHIKRIRKKLAAYGEESHIQTVWGIGYRWRK